MRIGIDCLALQSDSRTRGIGRFSKNFLDTLLAHTEHEYILYVYDGLPIKMIPSKNVQWINVWPGGPSHQTGLESSVYGNPDKLDALLLLSPGESYVHKSVEIPRIYAVIYDLIPLIFKEKYLVDPWFTELYYKYLNAICDYDHLFTLSESARDDILQLIPAVSRESVSVIGAATDPIFTPISPANLPDLPELKKPFFLHVGGGDTRKGGATVLKAFAALPNRGDLSMIFSYGADKRHIKEMVDLAGTLGISDNFIFNKYSSDEYVRQLYSRCISMVFPSQYEGFGLPILEAMSCGASVIAGNNSSQIELVHSAGVLTDPDNIESLSNIMYILSTDKDLNNFIRCQCLERSKDFSWEGVVDKFLTIATKPRLAVFSPIPPILSGISDYIVNLLPYLSKTFDITIYIDNYMQDIKDELPWKILPHSSFDPTRHDHILYQMGNSEHHCYMYPYMMKYPGVVTLHDFDLHGFHRSYGDLDKLAEEDVWGHRDVVNRARAVITHVRQFENGKIHYVPFPKGVAPQSLKERNTSIKIVVPGWLSETKLNFLCLRAFSSIEGKDVVLIFAGDGENGQLKEFVQKNHLEDWVTFTGRLTKEDYEDIISEADIGVILRKSPTNGEMSAALFDLLAAGVPTIVSDVDSLREIPDDVVLKYYGENETELAYAINFLINNKMNRSCFGESGRDFVRDHHNPERSAEMYTQIILGGR